MQGRVGGLMRDSWLWVRPWKAAVVLIFLLGGGRLLTRGSMVFSHIAHVYVCHGTCHRDVRGQKESFVKIIGM